MKNRLFLALAAGALLAGCAANTGANNRLQAPAPPVQQVSDAEYSCWISSDTLLSWSGPDYLKHSWTPADCTERHNVLLQTISGVLPSEASYPTLTSDGAIDHQSANGGDQSKVMAAALGACDGSLIGRAKGQRMSRLAVLSFIPSPTEWESGDRSARCVYVVAGVGERTRGQFIGADLPATVDELVTKVKADAYSECVKDFPKAQTEGPAAETSVFVDCSTFPGSLWRATASYSWPDKQRAGYPSDKELHAFASQVCGQGGGTTSRWWAYYPGQVAWGNGVREISCSIYIEK